MNFLLIIMGFIDLNAAVTLTALAFGVQIPLKFLIIATLALLLKACISITDIGSLMDFTGIILIILSIFFALPPWLFLVSAALIGFKGIKSFAA